jgi:Co/Zn/Cd efflux system component
LRAQPWPAPDSESEPFYQFSDNHFPGPDHDVRMAAGSTGSVVAAMMANAAIAVLKFVGFMLTGSPSMPAKAYHSVSDTGNQVLLLVGIRQSRRDATTTHPFGDGKAQFSIRFWCQYFCSGSPGGRA